MGNRAEDTVVISSKKKKKKGISHRMKVLKNSAGCKMQREHLSYLIHYKFISNTDTCVLTTMQQKKKKRNLKGMNFIHPGYEFLSAENNNGYYESEEL